MKDSKNQIIRSMKSYQMGGTSDESCMEEYIAADGKKRKRRKQKCNAGQTKRVFSGEEIAKGAAKIAGGIGALIGGVKLNKKYGLVDKTKEALGIQRKGGSVKRTVKKRK
jgi:hypothetical protein